MALDISSSAVVDSLFAFQRRLLSTGADARLVERENIHFTVKFLGEITEAQLQAARERLRSIDATGGVVEVRGVGAFPSTSRPSVVWAGVAPGHERTVRAIAEKAMSLLEGIGEDDRRGFTPHVTLARVKSPRNTAALSALIGASAGLAFGEAGLTELKLKSSILGPRGPTYADIEAFGLT